MILMRMGRGLFCKYGLEIQLFRADDIMEDSKYIVNQVIEAGTNTNLELQNKKGDKWQVF